MASTPACAGCTHQRPFVAVLHKQSNARRTLAARAQQVDEQFGFVAKYADQFRAVPIVAGATGFLALLANRTLSGVAPVVDASSSQSRVDVLVIAMAATLALTGFQWLTLKPVTKEPVQPDGKEVFYVRDGLKDSSRQELNWLWGALKTSSCCRSLVVLHSGVCVFQTGLAPDDCTPGKVSAGNIVQTVIKEGRANYLANVMLFPGRIEFKDFLPYNLSCLIVAPIGKSGALIVGGDTARGFSKLDQAWITSIADKLEDTLETNAPSGVGFKKA